MKELVAQEVGTMGRRLASEWRSVLDLRCRNANTPGEFHRRVTRYLDFLERAGIPFDAASPKDVQGFISNVFAGKSAGTKRNHLDSIRAWYRWALERGSLKQNPADFGSVAFLKSAEAVDPDYPSPIPIGRLVPHNAKPGYKPGVDYSPVELEERVDRHVEAWLAHLEAFGVKPKTRVTYQGHVRHFLEFIQRRKRAFDHLEARDFDAWLLFCQKDRKLVTRTINGAISAIRNFYRWLRKSGFILDNPAGDCLRMLKAPRLLPRPLTEAEVLKVIAAAEHVKDRAIVETIYATGARIGEMQAMRLGGVNLKAGTIVTIGKYSRERMLLLTPGAVQALKAYLEWRKRSGEILTAESPLWMGSRGKPMKIKHIRGRLKATVLRAGIEGRVTPHQFRHSFCTHLLDHGADLRAVQELAGHEHIASTQIYTGVSPVRLGEVYKKAHPGFQEAEEPGKIGGCSEEASGQNTGRQSARIAPEGAE